MNGSLLAQRATTLTTGLRSNLRTMLLLSRYPHPSTPDRSVTTRSLLLPVPCSTTCQHSESVRCTPAANGLALDSGPTRPHPPLASAPTTHRVRATGQHTDEKHVSRPNGAA